MNLWYLINVSWNMFSFHVHQLRLYSTNHINALNYPAMRARERLLRVKLSALTKRLQFQYWWCIDLQLDVGADLMANVQWKLFNKDSVGVFLYDLILHLTFWLQKASIWLYYLNKVYPDICVLCRQSLHNWKLRQWTFLSVHLGF